MSQKKTQSAVKHALQLGYRTHAQCPPQHAHCICSSLIHTWIPPTLHRTTAVAEVQAQAAAAQRCAVDEALAENNQRWEAASRQQLEAALDQERARARVAQEELGAKLTRRFESAAAADRSATIERCARQQEATVQTVPSTHVSNATRPAASTHVCGRILRACTRALPRACTWLPHT